MDCQADLIDHDIEQLIYYVEHWMLSGNELTDEIKRFIDFCSDYKKRQLHAPRTGDGKSFYQRREEANGQKNVL